MRPHLLAALCLTTLAACSQGSEPIKGGAEPAPDAPVLSGVDLSQPVRLLGTEPFWGIELTGSELVYSGLERPEQRAPQPQATLQGNVATFQTQSEAGTPFNVTLTATECSDGMSDRTYPLTAMVKVGEETLMGCAAASAAFAGANETGPMTVPGPAATPAPPAAASTTNETTTPAN